MKKKIKIKAFDANLEKIFLIIKVYFVWLIQNFTVYKTNEINC